MGKEALGPVKAQCPSVGECHGRKEGVGGWMGEHPHKVMERGDGIRGFKRGGLER